MRTMPRSAILHDRRAAADGAGGRRDDGADGHVLVDDRAARRRLDRRVLEALLGEVEVRFRADDAGFRVLITHRDLLELLRRDDARLEHVLIALLVALRDGELASARRRAAALAWS